MITPYTLSGFQELLPEDQIRFNAILDRIKLSFELFGFTPLDTPVLEASEILLAKAGGETEKQIYTFDKGDKSFSMRFDLTVPLAKYVAMNAGRIPFPFRRYQIGKVYRGERAQRGRFREFYQCDIDIVGDGELSVINEAEVPAVIYNTFIALGLSSFVIHINNRKILNGLFSFLGISENSADIMRTIDKIDKIGWEKTLELLICECAVDENTAESVISLLLSEDPLGELTKLENKNETLDLGIRELRTVADSMRSFGVPDSHFCVDLKIARGLDYYTGTVYETFMMAHPEIGSICSGGRYDDLAGYYTDRHLPGVGISIGPTRLFYILSEQGYLNPALPASVCDAIILPMTEDIAFAARTAAAFRAAGIKTAIYTENKKFKQKITYADRLGAPFAVIIGEDEIAAEKITLRDMETGEQTTASANMIIAGLKEKIEYYHGIKPIKA